MNQLENVEVDSIIRTARKPRNPKACYPCWKRKVKCSRGRPCTTCTDRNHIDLCSYEAGDRRQSLPFSDNSSIASGEAEESSSLVMIPRPEWDSLQAELQTLRARSLLIADLQQQVQELQARETKFNAMIKVLKARQQAVRARSSSESQDLPVHTKLVTADSVIEDANQWQPEPATEYPMYLSGSRRSIPEAEPSRECERRD